MYLVMMGTTCKVVDAFKFENLKRCSGHNDMLEGQKRGSDGDSREEALNAECEKLRKEVEAAQNKLAEAEKKLKALSGESKTTTMASSNDIEVNLRAPKLEKNKTWDSVQKIDQAQ